MENKISISTIYDNYIVNSNLKNGWGFSALIKINNKNILFDTGANSKILLDNMRKMGIDPKNIDFVFISHRHYDHIGGLPGILEINPGLKVYYPESFSGPTQIISKVWTTGPMGKFIKEQSLILETKKGLALITGCSHPGIINIIKKTKEIFSNKNIYLVLGGFHLFAAFNSKIKNIIAEFKKNKIQNVAPCHCSGDRARELFEKEYKKNYFKNGVGKIIEI